MFILPFALFLSIPNKQPKCRLENVLKSDTDFQNGITDFTFKIEICLFLLPTHTHPTSHILKKSFLKDNFKQNSLFVSSANTCQGQANELFFPSGLLTL